MRDYISREQFKSSYRKKIKPKIRRLERERIRLRNLVVLSSFFTTAALGYYLLGMFQRSPDTGGEQKIVFIIMFIALSGTITRYLKKFITRNFRLRFKASVVNEIFSQLLQEFSLESKEHIKENDFKYSKLFTNSYTDYTGEDLVRGTAGNNEFEFSELKVDKSVGSRRDRRNKVIFYGLFLKCKLQNSVSSPIIMKSDKTEKIIGSVGRKLGSLVHEIYLPSGFHLVQLESADFERRFAVYSKDQISARVTLNPNTIENLNKIFRDKKERIELSLIHNNLYIAIHSFKNHFEPSLFSGSVISWREVRDVYDMIKLIIDLIDCLSLNKSRENNQEAS